jgi:hypothetical protein
MKTIRLITFVIVAAIVFSVWTPVPVFAKSLDGSSGRSAGSTQRTVISLTVLNRTLGSLTMTLDGPAGNYIFSVPRGKTTFSIKPGKYTYSITYASSNPCKSWSFPRGQTSVTKIRKFVNAKENLGPYTLCEVK